MMYRLDRREYGSDVWQTVGWFPSFDEVEAACEEQEPRLQLQIIAEVDLCFPSFDL